MEKSHCSISISSLICEEDAAHLLDENDMLILLKEKDSLFLLSATDQDDEYIETLVSRESSFECRTTDSSSFSSENLIRCARSHCICWILKMRACFGFGYQTAYLAVTYFDRFFIHQNIDEGKTWAMKLLSVACFSLAAKMEECKPPALSEYSLEEYEFSTDVIQRMELFLLNALEWRLCSVTPFAYLGYFASKFQEEEEPMVLCSRAIGFIFAIIEATSLVEYRPSIIAAAGILAATSNQLTRKIVECKMRMISLLDPLGTEHVFSCYSLMIQKSQKEKLKPSKFLVSSEVSENYSIDVHNPISFSDTGNKRRRLESHQI